MTRAARRGSRSPLHHRFGEARRSGRLRDVALRHELDFHLDEHGRLETLRERPAERLRIRRRRDRTDPQERALVALSRRMIDDHLEAAELGELARDRVNLRGMHEDTLDLPDDADLADERDTGRGVAAPAGSREE